MTTRPNARLLRNAYQAIEHGDLQPMLAMPSPGPGCSAPGPVSR